MWGSGSQKMDLMAHREEEEEYRERNDKFPEASAHAPGCV